MSSRVGAEVGAEVLAQVADGVGTLTLNRPERRNAMTERMLEELAAHVAEMAASDAVGAIVLTGSGRAFCAGGDVQDFDENGGEGGGADAIDPALVAWQQDVQRRTVAALFRSPKPVVAALPGAAAGAGMGLALAADLRVGCARTVMKTAFAGVGLSGDFGVAWLLDRVVGPATARELLLLDPRLDAEECLRLGLLNRLVDEADLAGHAHQLAAELAAGPREAFASMKANLADAPQLTLEASMDAEIPRHKATGLSAYHRAAVRAFVRARPPGP